MLLVETSNVPVAALPIAAFRDHLRLGTGFADDGVQDAVLEAGLRAALALIEARTGKAILQRAFELRLSRWRSAQAQLLPLGPVVSVSAVQMEDAAGATTLVDAALYRFERVAHGAWLMPVATRLPTIPGQSQVVITFDAGFGAAWSDVPADIAQAVFMLAAWNYEHRHGDTAATGQMPGAVAGLIERHRNLRIGADPGPGGGSGTGL
jgi:uncharacterized phiE125 gp8 family phage protein